MNIYDQVEPDDASGWFPANPVTALLVACLNACKDATYLMGSLAPSGATLSYMHGLNILVTPVISLLDNVDILYRTLPRPDISHWSIRDCNALRACARSIRKHKGGTLRQVRNKWSAHHDAASLQGCKPVSRPSVEMVLRPTGEALLVLLLLLKFEVYEWARSSSLSDPDVLQLYKTGMVCAPSFRFNVDGHPIDLAGLQLVRDPRCAAYEVVQAGISQYNRLAGFTAPPLPIIKLTAEKNSLDPPLLYVHPTGFAAAYSVE